MYIYIQNMYICTYPLAFVPMYIRIPPHIHKILHHISEGIRSIRVRYKYMIDMCVCTYIILRSRCICVRKIICAWRVRRVRNNIGNNMYIIYCERASKFSRRSARTTIKNTYTYIIIIIIISYRIGKKFVFNNRQMCSQRRVCDDDDDFFKAVVGNLRAATVPIHILLINECVPSLLVRVLRSACKT